MKVRNFSRNWCSKSPVTKIYVVDFNVFYNVQIFGRFLSFFIYRMPTHMQFMTGYEAPFLFGQLNFNFVLEITKISKSFFS